MNERTDEKETRRLEAFSDGVFAIAITLLVLEIKLPHLVNVTGAADLWKALAELWPSFLAFTLSFFAILIMWFNHHGFFKLIDRVNNPFSYANGFLLFTITFVPFPTAVLAQYIDTPAAKAAVVFYSAAYLMINIAFNLLLFTASYKRALIKLEVSEKTITRIRKNYLLGFPIYLVATFVAFFNVWASLLLCLPLVFLWATMEYQ